ncbi:hypothetical protein [Actinoallomurus sp. NPDC050550]|uniref:hypothetical protein n=1 Tax=Actinoallomurus sp. NPDC050550 TaxID=3154937 RepID=UPI003411172B
MSRPGDPGGLLPRQHDDTNEGLLIGEYGRGLPYDLMTFEERDQVDAERTDAIRDRVQPAHAARYPTLRSPPTVKIIDRVKTYIREKKGSDPRSTGNPLDGAADPAPAQRDRATHEQNRDDKRIAVSTADETPVPEPAAEPAAEPVTEPATEPAAEPVTEPATEPVTELITEPAAEPATAPAACPRCGATGEAPCTTPSGKATKTHKGREQ